MSGDVALRKESVDRNADAVNLTCKMSVALRKESVDRNVGYKLSTILPSVALRKESVDRNGGSLPVFLLGCWSLSARRAWIEIG